MDYAELGKTPISEEQPSGGDCRYEPEFEALQAEIDKLGSPTASSQVDWDRIVESATQILASQSKDLTVASYLAVGLVHTQGITGLDRGLVVIHDLIETFWDQLYPAKKRMRGRLGALNWWLEKTEAQLQKQGDPKPLPAEEVNRMMDNLKAIDEILVEKMPEPPLLRPIQRIVERFEVQKEAAAPPKPATEATEPAPAAAKPQSAPKQAVAASQPQSAPKQAANALPSASGTTEPINDTQDAMRAADAALRTLRQAAGIILTADTKNSLAFRLRRISAWARIDALPPNNDGVTQIPPPPPQVIESLNQLRESGNLQALIENAEQKLSQFIFWFDLNRMVAEGLGDLGNDHQAARSVVCQDTAGLIRRLGGIESLSFSDGLPFADVETRKWLKTIGAEGRGAAAPGDAGGTSSDTDQIRIKLQEAKTMARKKKLVEGVNLLQQQMRLSESRCIQMRWRLAIVELLLSVKKSQLALPHAEQVLDDIESYRLETWDPNLALEGLNIAWQTFNAQNTNDHKMQAAELVQRIASIDSVAALRMQT